MKRLPRILLLICIGALFILPTIFLLPRALSGYEMLERESAYWQLRLLSSQIRASSDPIKTLKETSERFQRNRLYITDSKGKILPKFLRSDLKQGGTIPLEELRSFHRGARAFGIDPEKSANATSPFVSIPLKLGKERYYFYLILDPLTEGYPPYLLWPTFASIVFLLLSTAIVVHLFRKGTAEIKKVKEEGINFDVLASVSHDLRTPLTSIRGYAETLLLKEDQIERKQRLEFLEIVLDNCDALLRQISQLLDYQRLRGEESGVSAGSFLLGELLRDVEKKTSGYAAQHDVRLSIDKTFSDCELEGNLDLLARALTNLVQNAIRYNRPNGSVEIDTHQLQEGVEIIVRDSGHGIPEEELPYVVEQFYRVDRARSSTTGGSGLGLAITTEILELHGSHLDLSSVEGHGTTARFVLKGSTNWKR